MKRLHGVTVSAIVLLLGSLFQLLLAVGMLFAGFVEQAQIRSGSSAGGTAAPPIPAWMPFFAYGFSAFRVALAAWGILTSIGLFRLRPWARYSVLVIGGCLAVFAAPQILIMIILIVVPLPLPANADPSQAQMAHIVTKVIFGVLAAIYASMCAVGVSWLVYFNRKRVCETFAGTAGQMAASRRPILISVVAVFSLIGGATCLLMVFLPLPGAFLGLTLRGWGKVALYLVYGGLLTAAGLGLWRLEEWARRLSLGMQLIGLAQFALYIARPSLFTRYSEEIGANMELTTQPQLPAQFQNTIYAATFGFSALLLIAIMAILHHYRRAFGRPDAPARIESPT